jgi:hypothetical protein
MIQDRCERLQETDNRVRVILRGIGRFLSPSFFEQLLRRDPLVLGHRLSSSLYFYAQLAIPFQLSSNLHKRLQEVLASGHRFECEAEKKRGIVKEGAGK